MAVWLSLADEFEFKILVTVESDMERSAPQATPLRSSVEKIEAREEFHLAA